MKPVLLFIVTIMSLASFGQDKSNYAHFNKLTEVTGTAYVIASVEHWGKLFSTKARYFLFINTKTGTGTQVDFPSDGYIENLQQVKIDSLGINLIVVAAQTIDLDGRKGIDWNDPKQIIILSTDGQQRTQLTDNNFFASTWAVNNQTGAMVITGYYDSNGNNKYDKTDKSGVLIYDLKTLKQTGKL